MCVHLCACTIEAAMQYIISTLKGLSLASTSELLPLARGDLTPPLLKVQPDCDPSAGLLPGNLIEITIL